jgi:hypothetical protein
LEADGQDEPEGACDGRFRHSPRILATPVPPARTSNPKAGGARRSVSLGGILELRGQDAPRVTAPRPRIPSTGLGRRGAVAGPSRRPGPELSAPLLEAIAPRTRS